MSAIDNIKYINVDGKSLYLHDINGVKILRRLSPEECEEHNQNPTTVEYNLFHRIEGLQKLVNHNNKMVYSLQGASVADGEIDDVMLDKKYY